MYVLGESAVDSESTDVLLYLNSSLNKWAPQAETQKAPLTKTSANYLTLFIFPHSSFWLVFLILPTFIWPINQSEPQMYIYVYTSQPESSQINWHTDQTNQGHSPHVKELCMKAEGDCLTGHPPPRRSCFSASQPCLPFFCPHSEASGSGPLWNFLGLILS